MNDQPSQQNRQFEVDSGASPMFFTAVQFLFAAIASIWSLDFALVLLWGCVPFWLSFFTLQYHNNFTPMVQMMLWWPYLKPKIV